VNEANKIKFSVVIPITVPNDYLRQTCRELHKFSQKNFEILIFSNHLDGDVEKLEKELGAKIVQVGDVSPAIKRDKAMEYAHGEYLAFTDDDAYPEEHWLEVAEKHLADGQVAAIGGPQLTPPEDTFWQKVSGAMFMSPLSGLARIRYMSGKCVKEITDWPSVNFIVKKSDFEKVGGFSCQYYPGEDTKLCLDVVKKLGKKILYVPDLIVFHHRRSGFRRHLKQTGNYGLHRGYFAKVYPETSRKFSTLYFVPSIFVIFLFLGLASSFFSGIFLKIYLFGLATYLLALIISTLSLIPKTKSFWVSLATIPYLISFHIWYGIRFVQGLVFTKDLKSKLGR
jgi:GT2 family glycosyltransferase